MSPRRTLAASLVVTFPTTQAAMACEELCERRGLPGRMIPVPSQISAGCGLAWKASPQDGDALSGALAEGGVPVSGMDVIDLWEISR